MLQHGAWIDDVNLAIDLTTRYNQCPLQPWIQHGAEANNISSSRRTALHSAAMLGYNVRELLHGFADVDERDKNGATPLMLLVETTDSSINFNSLQLLFEHGANLHAIDRQGRTVLHYAIRGGSEFYVNELLEYGADPNAQDDLGRTPLLMLMVLSQRSVVQSSQRVLEALLRGGGDPYLCDQNGVSPVELLASHGSGRRFMMEHSELFAQASTTSQ